MVPGSVLQGDGQDVHHRMVEGLPRRGRVELLRITGAGADDYMGVVTGMHHDRFDPAQVRDPGP